MHVKSHMALIAIAALTGGSGLLVGGSVAASTPGGLVHVYDVNPGTTNMGSIVITGVIGDSGTDQSGYSADANEIVLSQGTFEVNTSAIQKKFSIAKPKTNPTNCGVVLAATAPATLFNGTGAYQGITGTVTLHITSAAVLPRTPDGACDESPNAVAVGEVTISEGSGTISFQ
jgi:hypothetical protein